MILHKSNKICALENCSPLSRVSQTRTPLFSITCRNALINEPFPRGALRAPVILLQIHS